MEWISVKERLPMDKDKIKPRELEWWIYDPVGGVRRTLMHPTWWNTDTPYVETVTHWMDVIVPEPPEVTP